MKISIIILICFSFYTLTISGQCEKIVINESLFNEATQHGFDLLYWNGKKPRSTYSGNGKIFTLDQDTLKFAIGRDSYENSNKGLVTNGILKTDTTGNQFYEIKLYFPQRSKIGGGTLQFDYLCYDLSELLHNKKNNIYIKFVDCREIIYYSLPK